MNLKFRAWDLEYEKMVVVDIINLEDGKLDFVGYGITYFRKAKDIELMQSTGFTDKNGREIFEGDVVKMAKDVYSEPTYYEVIRVAAGTYRLESSQHGCELWLRHDDCYIVGNIYENPELLEVQI